MRRKLFIFLAIFFVGLFLPLQTFAQDDPDNRVGIEAAQQQINDYKAAVEDCSTPSLECLVRNTYTFLQIEMAINIIGNECYLVTAEGECQPDPPPDTVNAGSNSNITYKRGFIGDMYHFMGRMYEQPAASTGTYVADVLNSANIATPAYAQGLGFAALDPILELWKKFRNISYICFIFVFIVIGFMIMFRAKVGSQNAVTAQQAIPNVIVSLIFVTFSYAIAGLLIDLMYLTMYMMVGLFSGEVTADAINYNIFKLMEELFKSVANGETFNQTNNIIKAILESAGGVFASLGSLGGIIGGLTLTVVLSIAILISTFKLFFELLKSYASIVMNVVIAPVILMAGAIPGKSVVKPWIMGLVGNLAAFPTVLLMIIIYKEFSGPISNNISGGFNPPFLLNSGTPGIIGYIMAFAIVLALPEVVSKVKKAMGASDGFGFELAKAASGRVSEAWNKGVGVGPLRASGKGIMKQAALLPVRAATGYAGSKILSGVAKAKGLDEQTQRNWGRFGGATGFIAGPRVLGKAPSIAKFAVRNLGEAGFDVARKHVSESAKNEARETREGAMGGMVGAALDLYRGTTSAPATSASPAAPTATTPPRVSRSRTSRRGYDASKEGAPTK